MIGIVPENDSTGGKVKQKGLSKKGVVLVSLFTFRLLVAIAACLESACSV